MKKKKEFYNEVDQLIDNQSFIESIEEQFGEVDDPRLPGNCCYSLVHLLVIILSAILAGANTITDIHTYACIKFHLFSRLMPIEKPPCYSVFWWLLTRFSPEGLETCLVRWIQELPKEDKEKLIAIDGKHLRGAARNQKIHLVSAWESHRSLLLGQVKAEEKSNEITAIPELLDVVDIEGATVTIDAAGCQKEIVEKIVKKKGGLFYCSQGKSRDTISGSKKFLYPSRSCRL